MSRRRLSEEERALWKGITRAIAPLRNARGEQPDKTDPPAARPAHAVAPPPVADRARFPHGV